MGLVEGEGGVRRAELVLCLLLGGFLQHDMTALWLNVVDLFDNLATLTLSATELPALRSMLNVRPLSNHLLSH